MSKNNNFYAPNNLEASKRLFTGRTKNLEEIFEFIEMGNCVALYGERKCGKSLTLEMIRDIINNNSNIGEIIDQTLSSALSNWKETNRFIGFKAIYITFESTRNEEELVEKFLEAINETPSLASILSEEVKAKCPEIKRLGALLKELQSHLVSLEQKLVVLLDEMEILEGYENNLEASAIAEVFCERSNFKNTIFIHAGSHEWLERVSKKGSIYTHLEYAYLKSIDRDDMVNFLLSPLKEPIKTNVVELSGGKPLYIQHIGQFVLKNEQVLLFDLEEELLKNNSIHKHINQNIYQEVRLDADSKKLLAAIAHKPDATVEELVKLLNVEEHEVKKKLSVLFDFGTIDEDKGKYRIVGKLIETHGKNTCDNLWKKSTITTKINLVNTNFTFGVTSMTEVDLLVVTALQEELAAVLELQGDRKAVWEKHQSPNKHDYYTTRLGLSGASDFSVCAIAQSGMGGLDTAGVVSNMLSFIKPKMACMVGICAGWREKSIELGDVIVASHAFIYDVGKMKNGKLLSEMKDFAVLAFLKNWLQGFTTHDESWIKSVKDKSKKPLSLRYQQEYLLFKLKDSLNYGQSNDWIFSEETKKHCPNYSATIKQLKKEELVEISDSITLAEKGKKFLLHLQLENGQNAPVLDRPLPKGHFGPFASGNNVVEDTSIFDQLAGKDRKVIALEMEAAAFLKACQDKDPSLPAFIAKGVCDYADGEKNDDFHKYAAETSAYFMLHFVSDSLPKLKNSINEPSTELKKN